MGQLIGFSSLPLRFSFPVSFGVTFEIKHVKKKKIKELQANFCTFWTLLFQSSSTPTCFRC